MAFECEKELKDTVISHICNERKKLLILVLKTHKIL
jgi:hypothetical protein